MGQTPDFWGNNYFDDSYYQNGKLTRYEGYCTDVWFDAAERFIESHLDEPFFCLYHHQRASRALPGGGKIRRAVPGK